MRRFAFLALFLAFNIFAATPKEIQKLEKTLANDRDAGARAEAAWQLGQEGATESVPALIKALETDTSPAVRANAAASLWNLGEASSAAIPALTKALEDASGSVVGNAAGALLKLGTPKAELIPAYRRLLTHADCSARVVALKALATEVPAAELFEHAWECSNSATDSDDRSEASKALRKIAGRKDKKVAARMVEILKTPGTRDVTDLISALADYEPPVKESVPVIAALLRARDERTSSSAAAALGDMKAASLPVLPDLIQALETHPQNKTRERAAEAIGEIGPKASAAVPALTKAGRDDKWPDVRKAAVSALGEMREAAKEAIPMLREQLTSTDDWMRLAARNALFRVDPEHSQEAADLADKHQVEEKGILFEDLTQMAATLPARLPEAYEVMIYDKYALIEVPQSDSPTGRGEYNYKAGTVTGPREDSDDDCKKKIALAKVDFSVVPRLVKQAPGLLGAPSGQVSYVALTTGMFCRAFGWNVYVKDAGLVEFRLDGKVGKVQKF